MPARAPRASSAMQARLNGVDVEHTFLCVPISTLDAVGGDERAESERGEDDATKHEVRCVQTAMDAFDCIDARETFRDV